MARERGNRSSKRSGSSRRRGSSNSNKLSLDFGGVERRVLIPEGQYDVEVAEVKQGKSGSGDPKLVWKMKIVDADNEKLIDKTFLHSNSLTNDALWSLAGLLEALGVDVPDGPADIDLKELVGLQCSVNVTHRIYNDTTYSQIQDYWPIDEAPGNEKDTGVSGDGEGDDGEGEGDDDLYAEDDILDMKKQELIELAEEHDIELSTTDKRTVGVLRDKILDELDELGLLEEDD